MKPYRERTVNIPELRYAACITWPRSGHHLLVRLCQEYFEEAFGYCEYYGTDLPCCRNFPCTKRDVITLSKNHDNHLDLQFDGTVPLIVQVREFVPSVISNFELAVRNGRPDTRASFEGFVKREFEKYNAFFDKWVNSKIAEERLVVFYEDLTNEVVETLSKVIVFLAPEHSIAYAKLRSIVERVDAVTVKKKEVLVQKAVGVRQFRNVEDFRHYDKDFLSQFETNNKSKIFAQ
jgi:hypothetical protein